MRIVAVALALLAPQGAQPFEASVRPLAGPQHSMVAARAWHPGCPVPLSGLRVLTVSHWGFDGRVRTGQLVVNADAVAPLTTVFRRLFELRFPIRHLRFVDAYGPTRSRPADGDISGAFECRQAVPSPCTGGRRTGTWSQHAYGRAIDLNPVENPYVGCGMTRDPKARSYMDRSRVRPGMVTGTVVAAFRSVGWGWGGYWSDSKDYMHFSANGH